MKLFRTGCLILAALISVSCITNGDREKELDIGLPTKKFKLNVTSLNAFMNLKLLTDSSRNLITQLGKYKFSTSIDAANAIDNRYNPDVFIYYDYEGLQLKYVFKGAGLLTRNELQTNLVQYQKYIYLETIIIEPKLYTGYLPFGISRFAKAIDVEKILGEHNPNFDEGSTTKKINYTYPERGLRFLFNFYSADITPDSTIKYITVSDSILEMKRYPTIYINVK